MNPLLLIIAALALLGGGYWWGADATTNAYEADKTKQVVQANADLVADAATANQAATDAIAQAAKAKANFRQLQGAFRALDKTTPLLAAAPACKPAVADPAALGAAPAVRGPDPAQLSLGAVWVWDSALAGADLPAGACGAADASYAACASASGFDLSDAWANHAANAETCAQDRARHQRLIDYIHQQVNQRASRAAQPN